MIVHGVNVPASSRPQGVFLIGGLATGRDSFGVLVGQRQGRALRYLGTVEIGYNRASVALLMERAAPLGRSSSPFDVRAALARVQANSSRPASLEAPTA